MEELVYVIAGSEHVEPLKGKYRLDFLLDRCTQIASQCSVYENPFGVVAVFLSRYGNGILTYCEASIEMFVRLSAQELASEAYREYAAEVEHAISRFQAKQTPQRLSVISPLPSTEVPELETAVAQGPLHPVDGSEELLDPDPLSSVATASLSVSSALRRSLIAAGLSSAKEVLDFHIAKGLASLDGIGATSEQYILDAIASLADQQVSEPTNVASDIPSVGT
jgi:hypothetical protein